MKNKVKSFTLLEMMIVVSIIAILAGVALPEYKKYMKKVKMVDGISLMKTVVNAEILYHTEHNKYLAIAHSLNVEDKKNLKDKLGIIIPNDDVFDGKFKLIKVLVCKNDSFIVWIGTTALSGSANAKKKINMVYPEASASYIDNFKEEKYNGTMFLYDYINDVASGEAPNRCKER